MDNIHSFKQVMSVKGVTLEKLHEVAEEPRPYTSKKKLVNIEEILKKADNFVELSKIDYSLIKMAFSDDDKDDKSFYYILKKPALLEDSFGFDVKKIKDIQKNHPELLNEIAEGNIKATYEQIFQVIENHSYLLKTVYDSCDEHLVNQDFKKLVQYLTIKEFSSIDEIFDLYAKPWKGFTESHPEMNKLLCNIENRTNLGLEFGYGYKHHLSDEVDKLSSGQLLEIFEEAKHSFKAFSFYQNCMVAQPSEEDIKRNFKENSDSFHASKYSIIHDSMIEEIEKSYTEGAAVGAFSYLEDPAKEEDFKGRKPLPPEIGIMIGKYLSQEDGKNLSMVNKKALSFAEEEVKRKFKSPDHNQSGPSK